MWTTKIFSISQGGVRQRGRWTKGFTVILNIKVKKESEVISKKLRWPNKRLNIKTLLHEGFKTSSKESILINLKDT